MGHHLIHHVQYMNMINVVDKPIVLDLKHVINVLKMLDVHGAIIISTDWDALIKAQINVLLQIDITYGVI